MKKNFKFYIIIWAILLAIYNLTIFLVKPVIPGYVINYDARFWLAWGVIILSFIGQLFCAKVAFDSKNAEKFFLNVSLITQSYTALIVTAVVSSGLMLIPDCPAWAAAIVCAVVLGLGVISVIKAKAAADIVSDIDDKIKAQTFFVKTLTVDAESLISKAKSDDIKAECKRVYEAVRFSDPVGHSALADIESQITIKFSAFSSAILADDLNTTGAYAKEIIALITERNNKLKTLK